MRYSNNNHSDRSECVPHVESTENLHGQSEGTGETAHIRIHLKRKVV